MSLLETFKNFFHNYVAVLGRIRTLFHCVFQSHYRVQNAIVQNLY